jgi:hypothetical protein
MFDVNAPIDINLLSAEGPKKITVRYPSDAEFTEWRKKKKVTQKDMGRRSFQIEQSRPERCDMDLVAKIRTDKETGPQIDEAEAFHVVSRLANCETSERPERDGANFSIRIKAMGKLQTTHVLRIPSMREVMDFESARSSVIFGQYGRQDIRINFQASADLYDKLKVSVEGYTGAVPVPHKAEAVNVLLQEVRSMQEEESEGEEEEG